MLSEKLGIPYDSIDLIQGDTEVVQKGAGTGGSRSSQMGGVAISRTAALVLEKAKRIAAHLLEAGVGDVEFGDGLFRVAGTDLSVGWPAVIAAAHDPARLPANEAPGLDENLTYARHRVQLPQWLPCRGGRGRPRYGLDRTGELRRGR